MTRTFDDYIDKYGLFTQKNGDDGDSMQRAGLYFYGRHLLREMKLLPINTILEDKIGYTKQLQKLEAIEGTGSYRRHPDPDKWYSNPYTTSRDQKIPNVIAMGAYGFFVRLRILFEAHDKRWGFYQNTVGNGDAGKVRIKIPDFAAPHHWNQYYRSFGFELDFLQKVGMQFRDSTLCLGAIIRVIKSRLDPEDTSDDINFTLALIQARLEKPTIFSWLARKIYKFVGNAPVNDDSKGILSRWSDYFDESTGAAPFYEMYKPIIEKYILE